LQEDRHADGRNQRNKPITATQGTVGNPFDAVAVGAGNHNAGEKRGSQQKWHAVQTHHGQAGDGDKRNIGTNHVHLAVGEVDHSNNAVNHRIADGDQGISAANVEAVNQHLEEVIDVRHYKAPKNLRRISLVESFSGLGCMGFHPL